MNPIVYSADKKRQYEANPGCFASVKQSNGESVIEWDGGDLCAIDEADINEAMQLSLDRILPWKLRIVSSVLDENGRCIGYIVEKVGLWTIEDYERTWK